MKPLYFTLAAEGSSDEMLLPIIEWTLRKALGTAAVINGDERISYSSRTVKHRIEHALSEYADTDLLIIHADADSRDGHRAKLAEIATAIPELSEEDVPLPYHIPIVPVQESEAWLLFNETAIRRAAANPNGKVRLKMPTQRFDQLASPKEVLRGLMDAASEQTGRKLGIFQRRRRSVDVANWIDDFSPLRKLDAFIAFEAEVKKFAAMWTAEEE